MKYSREDSHYHQSLAFDVIGLLLITFTSWSFSVRTIYLFSAIKFPYIDFQKCLDGIQAHLVLLYDANDKNGFPAAAAPFISRAYALNSEVSGPLSFMCHEDMLNCIQRDIAMHNPSQVLVYSFDDFYIEEMLSIAAAVGAMQYSALDGAIFRDKMRMKEHMAAHGIQAPQARHVSLEDDSEISYKRLVSELGTEFIFKPVDGSGSFDVSCIRDLEAFRAAIQRAQSSGFAYEAETYIRGTLFHCDFIIAAGEFVYEACGQYVYPVMEAKPNRMVASVMLPEQDPVGKRMLSSARQCAGTLQIQTGALHMEFFLDHARDQVFFLEMGFRTPGLVSMSRMADQTLYTYMLRLLLTGTPPPHALVDADLAVAGGVIPPLISGVIGAISPLSHQLLRRSSCFKQVGDVVDLSGPRYVRMFEFDTAPAPLHDTWQAIREIEQLHNVVIGDPQGTAAQNKNR